jgi:hypothetical protein
VPVCIILTVVTCGIYGLWYMYSLTNSLAEEYRDRPYRSGALVVVFAIITGGIYNIYWWYVTGQDIYDVLSRRGFQYAKDNSVIYLILDIFGLDLINIGLVQNDINTALSNTTGPLYR